MKIILLNSSEEMKMWSVKDEMDGMLYDELLKCLRKLTPHV
jgi:hypothetical protein